MSYFLKMKEYSGMADDWLDRNFAVPDVPERVLHESVRYSLLAGGKRLRPVLSLAVCDLLNGDRGVVLPFACAIELIHTYSLIHDDLPCMDNDDFRRGKPTNHKVYGEAMAVLAGDALLSTACEIMLDEAAKDDALASRRIGAARIIIKAAGISGMIAGQAVDLESENSAISYERLCYMHERKTGALIRASVMSSAVLCGADAATQDALSAYADHIGLAFQIKDDLLDCEGDSSVVGKTLGTDERNMKSTFVTVLGAKKAKLLLKKITREAVKALEGIGKSDFLIKTAAYIAERDK
jgi:geranylgeranyl diphosphate synthase type II